jgi:hypothetical protein
MLTDVSEISSAEGDLGDPALESYSYKQRYDETLSNFAYNFNLRHCIKVPKAKAEVAE